MALRAAVFWFTVATDNPSPGSQLMGLQYRNELAGAPSCCCLSLYPLQRKVRGPWACFLGSKKSCSRLPLFCFRTCLAASMQQRPKIVGPPGTGIPVGGCDLFVCCGCSHRVCASLVCRRCSELHKLVSSLHLLSFMLLDGRYRSPIEQLVGARLVPAQRHGARGSMPFDFLNQQLVFNGLTEFTRWAVPVFSAAQSKMLALGNSLVHHMQPSAAHTPSVASDPASWAHDCSVCDASPAVMGFAGSCGHVGCYVCLRAAVMDDPHARCSRCGVALSTLRRYEPWSVNTDT
eukprot:TRINITY_DN4951_c0_g1_i1.p1 TRINITY_DN4951_c0_g1~~TRINITY_DN4951_c0_g1_i1.p1  ORF type:complete len:290 (+),score=22.51 TRINITY_DN4951_c0_g1_i1:413-1282(+)